MIEESLFAILSKHVLGTCLSPKDMGLSDLGSTIDEMNYTLNLMFVA